MYFNWKFNLLLFFCANTAQTEFLQQMSVNVMSNVDCADLYYGTALEEAIQNYTICAKGATGSYPCQVSLDIFFYRDGIMLLTMINIENT